MQPMRKTSVVLHTVQHLKERLFGHSGVANPRDTYGYHCGLRLAVTKTHHFSMYRQVRNTTLEKPPAILKK